MGIVNKKHLYFDVESRTDKSLMVWALADATVNAKNKHVNNIATKEDVSKELIYSLNNIRTRENGAYGRTIGVGSYKGTKTQFNSQYTAGLELGLWSSTGEWNSNTKSFELTILGRELQKQRLTAKAYITIVLFNYIQIIDGKIISILKECIKLAFKNPSQSLCVDDIYKNNILVSQSYLATLKDNTKMELRGRCATLFNILSETYYFTKSSNNEIRFNGDLKSKEELINSINNTMINTLTDDVIIDLSGRQFYSEYITRTPIELIDYLSKHYSFIIPSDIITKNSIQAPIMLEDKIKLVEDKKKPNMNFSQFVYSGKARKTDMLEKNKRQIKIGKAAEKIVYEHEIERVRKIDPILTDKVMWESDVNGDGIGYDIRSINIDKNGNITDKYIEVKATSGDKNTPIDITRNEVECSKRFDNEYVIYRLYDFKPSNKKFKYYTINGDLTKISNCILEPTSYKLYL